jgi:hypothetical protein
MSNAKEFLVKNKKPIIGISAGVLVLGTASYFVFGYKDKDGNTLFKKWTGNAKVADSGSGGIAGGISKMPVKEVALPSDALAHFASLHKKV